MLSTLKQNLLSVEPRKLRSTNSHVIETVPDGGGNVDEHGLRVLLAARDQLRVSTQQVRVVDRPWLRERQEPGKPSFAHHVRVFRLCSEHLQLRHLLSLLHHLSVRLPATHHAQVKLVDFTCSSLPITSFTILP